MLAQLVGAGFPHDAVLTAPFPVPFAWRAAVDRRHAVALGEQALMLASLLDKEAGQTFGRRLAELAGEDEPDGPDDDVRRAFPF